MSRPEDHQGDRRPEGRRCRLRQPGLSCAELGETRKAIDYYHQQLKISQEIWDRSGEANALWNMSLAQDSLGERAEAVKLAKEALAICEQIERPYAKMVRRKLAEWQK